MNKNVIWHQFLQILFNHDIGTWFAYPYGFMCCKSMEFLSLYKAFTLSVQGKYGNYMRVYKGVCLEGFQMILKNWLAHFPFPRMRDIPHIYWLIMCNICIYLTSYMFIPSPCIHKWWLRIHDWVQFHFFLPIFLSHDNGNIVNPPICTHCIIGVCKLCKCTRHLHWVYKVHVLTVQGCII